MLKAGSSQVIHIVHVGILWLPKVSDSHESQLPNPAADYCERRCNRHTKPFRGGGGVRGGNKFFIPEPWSKVFFFSIDDIFKYTRA